MTPRSLTQTILITTVLASLGTACAGNPCLDDGWARGECQADGIGVHGETGDDDSDDGETSDGDGTGDGDGDVPGCADLPDDGDDCTLTQGYWKNHDDWPIAQDTQLCEMSYIDILHTPPAGEAWFILAHQAIAADLNVASGASMPEAVARALDDAFELLGDCGCAQGSAAEAEAVGLSELLDDYNNGRIGPGHCG